MDDWVKLLRSGDPEDGWEAALRRLPGSDPKHMAAQCRIAIHNWTIRVLHAYDDYYPMKATNGDVWHSPVEAILAWRDCLAYWENLDGKD